MTNQNDGITQSIDNQFQSTTTQLASSEETCESCLIEEPFIFCINPHTGQTERKLIKDSNCPKAIAYLNSRSA